jgi:hypothetical protein
VGRRRVDGVKGGVQLKSPSYKRGILVILTMQMMPALGSRC